MAVPPTPKEILRRELVERRRAHVAALSFPERVAATALLRGHVLPLLEGMKGRVAAYLPLGEEVDTLPLIAVLAERGVELALPHYVSSAKPARFLAWSPGDPLLPGPMSLRQPEPQAPEVAPAAFLTPLLAFDAKLYRLGYGAGFYDKAFAAFPEARRIGLAWDCQRIDRLPRDKWDVPLHVVATERQVYK